MLWCRVPFPIGQNFFVVFGFVCVWVYLSSEFGQASGCFVGSLHKFFIYVSVGGHGVVRHLVCQNGAIFLAANVDASGYYSCLFRDNPHVLREKYFDLPVQMLLCNSTVYGHKLIVNMFY